MLLAPAASGTLVCWHFSGLLFLPTSWYGAWGDRRSNPRAETLSLAASSLPSWDHRELLSCACGFTICLRPQLHTVSHFAMSSDIRYVNCRFSFCDWLLFAAGTARSRRRGFLPHPIPWTRLQASSTTRLALSLMYCEAEREIDIGNTERAFAQFLPREYPQRIFASQLQKRFRDGAWADDGMRTLPVTLPSSFRQRLDDGRVRICAKDLEGVCGRAQGFSLPGGCSKKPSSCSSFPTFGSVPWPASACRSLTVAKRSRLWLSFLCRV